MVNLISNRAENERPLIFYKYLECKMKAYNFNISYPLKANELQSRVHNQITLVSMHSEA